MPPDPSLRKPPRDTLLTFTLLGLVAAAVLVFLVGLLGEFFLAAVCIVTTIAAVGTLHYLVWGRSLSKEVAAEQPPEELPAETDGWAADDRYSPRRM
jgi:hypothetical protein